MSATPENPNNLRLLIVQSNSFSNLYMYVPLIDLPISYANPNNIFPTILTSPQGNYVSYNLIDILSLPPGSASTTTYALNPIVMRKSTFEGLSNIIFSGKDPDTQQSYFLNTQNTPIDMSQDTISNVIETNNINLSLEIINSLSNPQDCFFAPSIDLPFPFLISTSELAPQCIVPSIALITDPTNGTISYQITYSFNYELPTTNAQSTLMLMPAKLSGLDPNHLPLIEIEVIGVNPQTHAQYKVKGSATGIKITQRFVNNDLINSK